MTCIQIIECYFSIFTQDDTANKTVEIAPNTNEVINPPLIPITLFFAKMSAKRFKNVNKIKPNETLCKIKGKRQNNGGLNYN